MTFFYALRNKILPALLICLLCPSCLSEPFDPTPLKQKLVGTWELVATDHRIHDPAPEEPAHGITLIFTEQGTYTETFHIGPATSTGTYVIDDPTHLTFTDTIDPNNRALANFHVQFEVSSDTLTIITVGRDRYQRVQPQP